VLQFRGTFTQGGAALQAACPGLVCFALSALLSLCGQGDRHVSCFQRFCRFAAKATGMFRAFSAFVALRPRRQACFVLSALLPLCGQDDRHVSRFQRFCRFAAKVTGILNAACRNSEYQ
jgi:hypothetical protein